MFVYNCIVSQCQLVSPAISLNSTAFLALVECKILWSARYCGVQDIVECKISLSNALAARERRQGVPSCRPSAAGRTSTPLATNSRCTGLATVAPSLTPPKLTEGLARAGDARIPERCQNRSWLVLFASTNQFWCFFFTNVAALKCPHMHVPKPKDN
jgi:hypothetical protein